MKIITIIVTFNRLSLLKEAINAIQLQTIKNELIVINNGSTDGTFEWLEQQYSMYKIHQENKGGAGGFYTGLKEAYNQKADWVWVMDDDTIPNNDALEKLIEPIPTINKTNKLGFLCSRVNWVDGTLHKMNLPHYIKGNNTNIFDRELIPINSCSFVSALFSKDAIKFCGLPYKDFFIWGDDIEFTQRIVKNNFLGFYVPNSIVLHKTPENYSASIFIDNIKNLWKYKYDIRNKLFIYRKNKGVLKYGIKFLKNIFILPIEILIKRKENRFPFIKTIWSASWQSLFFNPQLDFVVD